MDEPDHLSHIPVHQSLGGGSVANFLLWRWWCGAATCLISAGSIWFRFRMSRPWPIVFRSKCGVVFCCDRLSYEPNPHLFLIDFCIFLPDMEISEESVVKAIDVIWVWINYALSTARDITVGRNVKLFLQVAFGLWFVSYIGSLFEFLTTAHIEVGFSFF